MTIARIKSAGVAILLAIGIAIAAGCNPNQAMNFGPTGEVNTPPEDQLSRDILRNFDGKDFTLGDNDREANVHLSGWPKNRRVMIPFWLGVDPLFPGFLRPRVGHIYVMSESVMVRPIGNREYLIRAGSKLFKSDTVLEATHTHYLDTGKMLPVVVRFVGTRVITVARDAPQRGTVTEKVPVLREVSLPMHVDKPQFGYARFTVAQPG